MSDGILFHKKTCSTSRQALALLKENGVEPEIRLYTEDVPTQKELNELIKKLGIKAEELVRKKEKLYKDEYEGKKLTQREWVRVLSKNPVLIERPIYIKGRKAVIGRPVENVLELI